MERLLSHRARGALACGFFLLAACRGDQTEKPAAGTKPTAKPTVAEAVPTPTEAAPEPTATAAPTPTPEPVAPSAEPETEPATEGARSGAEAASEITLLGIIQAGQSPSALIGYGDSQESFRKGESVFDQGTLREIREDSVVIRSDGETVTLRLRKAAQPESKAIEVRAPVAAEPTPPPIAKAIPRDEARAALASLSRILGEAGPSRVRSGRGYGLRLENVAADSFLAKLGLKSGDVLKKLNGQTIDDPAKLPDLPLAADRKELTVSVERNEIGLSFSRPLK